MKIVGGIYDEICHEPYQTQTVGSGLRGAMAVSRAARGLTLHSRATQHQADSAQGLAAAAGFSLSIADRRRPTAFTYSNPLARPFIDNHDLHDVIDLTVDDEVVLAFGMVDASLKLRARRLIIDPQQPGLLDLAPQFDYDASSLAIVANEVETRGMSGLNESPIEDCAKAVINRTGAEVVVVKRGALGATIVTPGALGRVGSFPTQTVWPIGSGDVFSAVFALCWGERGMDPQEAARRASRATAASCMESRDGPVQAVSATGVPLLSEDVPEMLFDSPRLYLAAPFFSLSQRWLVNLVRDALEKLGAEVFSPYHDVGAGPANSVAPLDLKAIDSADVVFALLDGLDPGTIFEVGYARARNTPVVALGERPDNPDLTMLVGSDVEVSNDLATSAYRSVWAGMK